MTQAPRWRRIVGFALASVWLHALAVVPLHAPEFYLVAADEVPVDLLLVLAVAVIGAAGGWPRLGAAVGALGLMLSAFSRACDVVSVLAFGKDFELADLPCDRAQGGNARAGRILHRANLLCDLLGRAAGLHRQFLDLAGDDGEASSRLTATRRLDRRVERE